MKSINCLLRLKTLKMRSILISALLFAAVLFPSIPTLSQNSVWAWGGNNAGEAGNGGWGDIIYEGNLSWMMNTTLVQLNDISEVTEICGGGLHTLALKNDGTVWAWGSNWFGQIGDGTNSNYKNIPVQVSGLMSIVAISAGQDHSLALISNGTILSWGYNFCGQLGDGTNDNKNVPTQLASISSVIAISTKANHSLALKSDGTVWAWGYNEYGQLGDGTYNNSNIPVKVLTLSNITAISAGDLHSLALRDDGTVWAWGDNFGGQLGDGTNERRTAPVQVMNLANVGKISAGGSHCLALKDDGTVWSWGAGVALGDGTGEDKNIPVKALSLSNIVEIAAGGAHSLALKEDGTVWSFGYNWLGQLGDGTRNSSYYPAQIADLSNVVGIAAGNQHSLAILNGKVAPPIIDSIQKMSDPFRLRIKGINFHSDAEVYLKQGNGRWENVAYKNEVMLILKKGVQLKEMFPKGEEVLIAVLNGDGGYATIGFTR